MFDDFVKQLRAYTCDCFSGNPKHLTWEAADRIEELETALRYYAKGYENPFGDDDSLIARKALEGRINDENLR